MVREELVTEYGGLKDSLYMIIFSHLSDISDGGGPKMRKHVEFIKFLLSKYARQSLKNIEIDPDKEWEESRINI